MDKNYYEILEIDKNASPEIIDKAYKTLAKKYHPDLQDESHKKDSEEKFKIINEAYQVLSNSEQKALYDRKLVDNTSSYYNQQVNNSQTIPQDIPSESYTRNLEYEQQINQARQKAYYDAYIQDLKNRGYKIKYKKSFSDYVKGFISIIAVILVLFLLWQIPFIKNYFIGLYNDNSAFRYLCDIFLNLFRD